MDARYEKAERLLDLALEMQAARSGLSLADIAGRFGVSLRTAMRMRDSVLKSFPQARELRGDDRVKRWTIPAGTLDRLLSLDAADLAAVEAAARLMEDGNRLAEAERLRALLARLRAILKPADARRIETDLEALLEAEGLARRPGPRPALNAGVVDRLRQAILACYVVRIDYRNRRNRASNARIVHPYGFLSGHRHYLVGWHDHPKAKDFALFSLADIDRVEILPEAFRRDPDFSLDRFAARSFGVFQEQPRAVRWLFRPDSAQDAARFRFHPDQVLEWQEDGALLVSFTAGGLLEMAWHLFAWGDRVKVLEPPELAAMLRDHRPAWPAPP